MPGSGATLTQQDAVGVEGVTSCPLGPGCGQRGRLSEAEAFGMEDTGGRPWTQCPPDFVTFPLVGRPDGTKMGEERPGRTL